MTDYGLKVSQDGYDVKTATDTQLVFSSKFGTYASMSIAVSGTSNQTSSSNITFSINHSLGVTPFVLVFYKTSAEPNNWQLFQGSSNFLLGFSFPFPTFLDVFNDKFTAKFTVSGSNSVTIKYYLFNVSA